MNDVANKNIVKIAHRNSVCPIVVTSSRSSNVYVDCKNQRRIVESVVARKYNFNIATKLSNSTKIDNIYNRGTFRQTVIVSNPMNPPEKARRQSYSFSFDPKLALQNPINKRFPKTVVQKYTDANICKIHSHFLPIPKDIWGILTPPSCEKHKNRPIFFKLVPNAKKYSSKHQIPPQSSPSNWDSMVHKKVSDCFQNCDVTKNANPRKFLKSSKRVLSHSVLSRNLMFMKGSLVALNVPQNDVGVLGETSSKQTRKTVPVTEPVNPRNRDGVLGKTFGKQPTRTVHGTDPLNPAKCAGSNPPANDSNKKTISSVKQMIKNRLSRIFDRTFDIISFMMSIIQKLYVSDTILLEKSELFIHKSREVARKILGKIMNTTLNDFFQCGKSIWGKIQLEIMKFHEFLKRKPEYCNFFKNISKFKRKMNAKFNKLSNMIAKNFINLEQNQQILTCIVVTLAVIGLYHIFATFFHSIFM